MIKQVLVVRKDLKMRRGKEIAQACHASIAFLTKKMQKKELLTNTELFWINNSFTKVCLQVDSEEELLAIYEKAKGSVNVDLIQDSGRTEFDGVPTYTCLALGPDESEKIDLITGHLRLY